MREITSGSTPRWCGRPILFRWWVIRLAPATSSDGSRRLGSRSWLRGWSTRTSGCLAPRCRDLRARLRECACLQQPAQAPEGPGEDLLNIGEAQARQLGDLRTGQIAPE